MRTDRKLKYKGGMGNQQAERRECLQEETLISLYCALGNLNYSENNRVHNKLNDLANTGDPGDGKFVVAVALHRRLAEEQVNLVIVPRRASLTLRHLGHGNKCGLWPKEGK